LQQSESTEKTNLRYGSSVGAMTVKTHAVGSHCIQVGVQAHVVTK
jgi:hypothetical protein